MPMSKRCEFIKKDGCQCGGYALSDFDFCYFHEPTKAADRKAAAARGGVSRANLSKSEAIIGELVEIVEETESKEPENGKCKTEINTLQDLQIFAEQQIKYINDNKAYQKLSAGDRAEMRKWAEFLLKLQIVMGLGAADRIKQLEALARKQLPPTING